MSFELALLASLFRALLVACMGLVLLGPIRHGWRIGASPRFWSWAALLTPALFPGLVVGYAYANSRLSLVHHPFLNEVLYTVLLLIRTVPFGVVASMLTPPGPLSREAIHCRRLASNARIDPGRWMRALFEVCSRGHARPMLIAVGTMFLVCFQDFELASMLGTTAWTVWLFDAQAAGLDLFHSFSHAALSCLPQAMVLACLAMTLVDSELRGARVESSKALSRWYGAAKAYHALAIVLGILLPTMFLIHGTIEGFAAMLQSFALTKEILVASGGALVAGMSAYGLASAFLAGGLSARCRWIAFLCGIPGLFGPLVLSLTLVLGFQQPIFSRLYNSPLPWLVGLTLYLLPRALVLRIAVARWTASDARFVAALLGQGNPIQRHRARDFRWTLDWSPRIWSCLLIAYWGYVDVTMAAILCPTSMVSVQVRLYNLMHYGHSSVLAAMVCTAYLAPVGAMLVLLPVLRRIV